MANKKGGLRHTQYWRVWGSAMGVSDLDKEYFLTIDSDRKNLISETEDLQNKKNLLSKEIGILKSKNSDISDLSKEVENINNILNSKQDILKAAEDKYFDFMLNIPNILDELVPLGESSEDNSGSVELFLKI